ncbi:hypothetical protein IMY05_003G0102500 [Salix suchowensis]|nr:hypothetical protein IMY05_003G0102500 [Salix suchowensis]
MLYIHLDDGSNYFPCAQQEEAKHSITISINLSSPVIKKTKKVSFHDRQKTYICPTFQSIFKVLYHRLQVNT